MTSTQKTPEEITPELKAKYFALYWGQEVLGYSKPPENYTLRTISENTIDSVYLHNRSSLYLRSIESLTDEEIKALFKIEFDNICVPSSWKLIKVSNTDEPILFNFWVNMAISEYHLYFRKMRYDSADYLRSISIALPYMEYSVDQLIQSGIVVLKK